MHGISNVEFVHWQALYELEAQERQAQEDKAEATRRGKRR